VAEKTVPSQLGRFRIDRLIGRGGAGVVYRAYDPKLGRTVALKAIAPAAGEDPTQVERLYREAKACASLQHPAIVTVHDVDEIDGIVFIVMEYLEGESLSAAIQDPTLTLGTRLDMLAQIATALDYAHQLGIVHRDVKPRNVQVLPNRRNIKLLDFGLASVPQADGLTISGTVMGTPYYMSPEQLQGARVDFRTDIYSCGALGYELLTGRRPFEGATVTEVMLKAMTDEPPAMNIAGTTDYQEVEQIIARALAKPAAERFASAQEMAAHIRMFLERHPDDLSIAPIPVSADTIDYLPISSDQNIPANDATPPPITDSGGTRPVYRPEDDVPEPPPPTPGPRYSVAQLAALFAALLIVAGLFGWARLRLKPLVPGPTSAYPPPSGVAPGEQTGIGTGRTPANEKTPTPTVDVDRPPVAVVTLPAKPSTDAGKGNSGPGRSAEIKSIPGDAINNSPSPTTVQPTAKALFSLAAGAAHSESGVAGASATLPVGLKYRLVYRRRPDPKKVRCDEAAGERDAEPQTEFHSGDCLRFVFQSNLDGYLFIAQQGSSGTWSTLFPDPAIVGGNHLVRRMEEYTVPGNIWFEFDDTRGEEHVFVFLSKKPLEQMSGALTAVARAEPLDNSVIERLKGRINSRDLILERPPQPSGAGDQSELATYVVNKASDGEALSRLITLIHK
jgi:serine/threonine-protein kinase